MLETSPLGEGSNPATSAPVAVSLASEERGVPKTLRKPPPTTYPPSGAATAAPTPPMPSNVMLGVGRGDCANAGDARTTSAAPARRARRPRNICLFLPGTSHDLGGRALRWEGCWYPARSRRFVLLHLG